MAVAGAIFGAGFGGWFDDKYGQRMSIIVDDVLFFVGPIVMDVAPIPCVIIVGRVLVGLGVGMDSMTSPLYISEASPTRIRAALISTNGLLITVRLRGLVLCPQFKGQMLLGNVRRIRSRLGPRGFSFSLFSPSKINSYIVCKFLDRFWLFYKFELVKPNKTDEEAKKTRLTIFALSVKTDPVEEDKRKSRSIRFSQPQPASQSQPNGKGNIVILATSSATYLMRNSLSMK